VRLPSSKRYADEKTIHPWDLGATLYMPATRKDLAEVVLEGKYPVCGLWWSAWKMRSVSMMFLCIQNLSLFLQRLNDAKFRHGDDEWPLVFIRPVIRTWGDG
jgi:hypothetical protein